MKPLARLPPASQKPSFGGIVGSSKRWRSASATKPALWAPPRVATSAASPAPLAMRKRRSMPSVETKAKIRKLVTVVEETRIEMDRAVDPPTRRAAAIAVIENPFAGRYVEDLSPLIDIGEELGALLAA